MRSIESKLSNLASNDDISQFTAKMERLMGDCRVQLYEYSRDNAQHKAMIERFDEVLSDKLNKQALEEFKSDVSKTYFVAKKFDFYETKVETSIQRLT